MSAETTIDNQKKKVWGGGISPFNVSWGKMYMWFFLVSDAFTFSSLLIAYGVMRHRFTEIWPKAGNVFTHFPFVEGHIELAYVALMTFILIMSSVTMVLAVDAGHSYRKIGEKINKSHATVISSAKRVKDLLEVKDKKLTKIYGSILKAINVPIC